MKNTSKVIKNYQKIGRKMNNKRKLLVFISSILMAFTFSSCYTQLYKPERQVENPSEQKAEAYENWREDNRPRIYYYGNPYHRDWNRYYYRPYWYDWDIFWNDYPYYDYRYDRRDTDERRHLPSERTTPSSRSVPSSRSSESSDSDSRDRHGISEERSSDSSSDSDSESDSSESKTTDSNKTEKKEGSRRLPEGR